MARRKCDKCSEWMVDKPTPTTTRKPAERPNNRYCTECVEKQGNNPDRYFFGRLPGATKNADGTYSDGWVVEWLVLGRKFGGHVFDRREDAEEWLKRSHEAILAGVFDPNPSAYVTPKKTCECCGGNGWVSANG